MDLRSSIDIMFDPLFDKLESGLAKEQFVISQNGKILIGLTEPGCMVIIRSKESFDNMTSDQLSELWASVTNE